MNQRRHIPIGTPLMRNWGQATTLDDRRGLFLETTWRMHPEVNAYVSEAFYDGQLLTHESSALQRISSSEPMLDGADTPERPLR